MCVCLVVIFFFTSLYSLKIYIHEGKEGREGGRKRGRKEENNGGGKERGREEGTDKPVDMKNAQDLHTLQRKIQDLKIESAPIRKIANCIISLVAMLIIIIM